MRGLLGALLLACGVLVAGLSGLCTLVILSSSLIDSGPEVQGIFPVALGFGGIPCLIGLAMIWLGRILLRKAEEAKKRRDQSDIFE
ncbi:hypothetical protein [Novosphingobium sp. M1R2S20]|uniref:Uncharacterized protein n=1 Tax=Novosphingobium rhizovicinum TaxID=3228928 RepID=A0ABV3R8C1_9SPHN